MIEFLLLVAAAVVGVALLIRRSHVSRGRAQDSSSDAAYAATDSVGAGWFDSNSTAPDSGACGADASSGDCGSSDGGGGGGGGD